MDPHVHNTVMVNTATSGQLFSDVAAILHMMQSTTFDIYFWSADTFADMSVWNFLIQISAASSSSGLLPAGWKPNNNIKCLS